MQASLTFNDVTLSPITHQNSLWIRAAELARALGYAQENSVSRIYRSNSDEFTPEMTQVIEIPAESRNGSPVNLADGRCRVFSLRGCHLVAMFSRTSVAKAFRRWVLDVLEKYAAEQQPVAQTTPSSTLTHAERAELKALVDAKLSMVPAELQRKARGEVWTRFNRHFRIPEYALLPAERMSEARDYLIEMQPKALRALPKAEAMPAPLSMPETHAHRVADMSPMEHVASIRELTRRIHDHEAALWGAVRRSLPSGRVGAAYVASGWMLDTMRSSFEALEANLDGIKASAHAILALGQA